VPSAGDKAAKGTALGRLGICMKRLWVKLVSEGDYLICPMAEAGYPEIG
jgi:hypothetical protein